MPTRILITALVALAAVAAVAAFALLDVVLAAAVAITGATIAGLAAVAADWDRHPTFEQRELARARRRAVKREKTAGARAKDRARWEAYQAKKQARR